MPRKKRSKICYEPAPDLQMKSDEISRILFPHVRISNVKCLRSFGSASRGTIARCHTIGKVMQMAMGTPAWYAIEFISERFDKMSEEDQIKTIIHELMHIPKTFGGGFQHHDFVCEENVDKMYRIFMREKSGGNSSKDIFSEEVSGEKETNWKNLFNGKR